jgi:phosphoribosylaminoimidazolecarboxamide formyltransferase/IMP cyclohydrolase
MNKKIALISVWNKTGIIPLVNNLLSNDYRILSTGGTYDLIKSNFDNENIEKISDYTGFPEVFGGRVKSLHPLIYSGILSNDKKKIVSNEFALIKNINSNFNLIDYVIVNLYPFEEVISKDNCSINEAIENIDIGGVSLIRAAAKNYNRVTILMEPADYEILEKNINTTQQQREILAVKAFHNITLYDMAISCYFSKQFEKNYSSRCKIYC